MTTIDVEQIAPSRGKRLQLAGHFVQPVVVEAAEPFDALVLPPRPDGRGPAPRGMVTARRARRRARQRCADDAKQPFLRDDFFLLVESARIRLAFAHDPHFAVALTGIEVLPHQLEAVYERMLPQVMLRFLLADDPGAGKTIMAGLLIKELRLRGHRRARARAVPGAAHDPVAGRARVRSSTRASS